MKATVRMLQATVAMVCLEIRKYWEYRTICKGPMSLVFYLTCIITNRWFLAFQDSPNAQRVLSDPRMVACDRVVYI